MGMRKGIIMVMGNWLSDDDGYAYEYEYEVGDIGCIGLTSTVFTDAEDGRLEGIRFDKTRYDAIRYGRAKSACIHYLGST